MNLFLKRFILRQEKNFFKEARKYFFSEGVLFVVKEEKSELTQQVPKSQNSWQFTVLVPKKTAKKASQRNALKRIGREALREVLKNNLLKSETSDQKHTFSLVLFLKKQITHEHLAGELAKIIEKL